MEIVVNCFQKNIISLSMVSVSDFYKEKQCTYKGEKYSVRDNGAVLKHPREGKRPRPTDNKWTFGKFKAKIGYMEIASVRIHRIVATAFHGEPPTKEHVVDHIDTNKQNNRPENLRWVTRLENVLLNPITAKRIANVCGSVEAFLADPAKYRDQFLEPNLKWMQAVTVEEAEISLKRMLAWAKSDNKRSSTDSLDEWIFSQKFTQNPPVKPVTEFSELIMAKTAGAAQRKWNVPSEFPCCPQKAGKDPIAAYAGKLKTGSVFCRNQAYSSLVFKSAMSDDHQALYVISESSEGEKTVKRWALAEITHEDNLFVHMSRGTFFTKEGAEKQFCLAQGFEWNGGDSIDDYF
ncbi:MAG: HNH endonuclease [Flavobacteriaceae bacterium]|nr:HNH endonuclease [Flavobacteriaceae bacterium]